MSYRKTIEEFPIDGKKRQMGFDVAAIALEKVLRQGQLGWKDVRDQTHYWGRTSSKRKMRFYERMRNNFRLQPRKGVGELKKKKKLHRASVNLITLRLLTLRRM